MYYTVSIVQFAPGLGAVMARTIVTSTHCFGEDQVINTVNDWLPGLQPDEYISIQQVQS